MKITGRKNHHIISGDLGHESVNERKSKEDNSIHSKSTVFVVLFSQLDDHKRMVISDVCGRSIF